MLYIVFFRTADAHLECIFAQKIENPRLRKLPLIGMDKRMNGIELSQLSFVFGFFHIPMESLKFPKP